METKLPLQFELPIGVYFDGQNIKNIELLRSNGIAEAIFTQKIPDKPYTWMGKVFSVAVKSIGEFNIGDKAREEYLRTKDVTIPPIILALPLSEVNSLLLEVHRRVWQNLIREQEVLCKYCGKGMKVDIDLNKVNFSEEDLALIEENRDWSNIKVDLEYGFAYKPLGSGSATKYPEYDGYSFNRFVFRCPTLGDAIKHEQVAEDSIQFWRRIAYEALQEMHSVIDGSTIGELPLQMKSAYGMKLFEQMLDSTDLHLIREAMREKMPTLPFFYEEDCICPMKKKIPVSIEASGFFSD